MFSSDYTRWITNVIFAAPTVWGVTEVQKAASALSVSQQVPAEAVAALGFSGCALVVIGGVGIICNELRNHEEWTLRLLPRTSKPTVEDNLRAERAPKLEPEPAPFEGLTPFTRVDGKLKPTAQYNYITQAVKLNKERRVAMILLRNNDRGEPFDLTETTWARNKKSFDGKTIKKFMSRSELNALKTKWEINGLICRLSPARNATYDAHNWEKIKKVAGGAPLPQ